MQRVGSYYNGTTVTYNDPQKEYVFPLTLGTANNDTWDNSASSAGGGNYDLTCVGYGTLKLPGSKNYNALMVRVHETEGTVLDFYCFFWYSTDNGAILAERIFGDGFFIDDVGYFDSEVDLSSGINSPESISKILYTNPVYNTLNVSVEIKQYNNDVIHYSITDLLGRQVIEGNGVVDNAHALLKVDMNNQQAGVYFLNLTNTEGEKIGSAVKLVKM